MEDSGTILVIDDEKGICEIIALTLESAGFQVLIAHDGREGIELFKAHADEIAAVLVDMTMPGLSGEQVFTELRAVRPDIRVILSSGYDEHETVERLRKKGLAGFISKPYQPGELVAEVEKALGLAGP